MDPAAITGHARPRTCYIHIGMAKSGSTSIQNALRKAQNADIVYGQFSNGTPNHGMVLSTLFAHKSEPHNKFLRFGTPETVIQEKRMHFQRELAEYLHNDHRDLILSAESLTGKKFSENPRIILDRFQDYFDRIHIICYIRPSSGFVSSRFQQKIRYYSPDIFEWSIAYPNYKHALEKWITPQTNTTISLRPFGRDYLADGSVVFDFCDCIGVERQADLHTNPSISFEALSLLFAHRMYGAPSRFQNPIDFLARRAVTRKLRRFGSHKMRISRNAHQAILDDTKDDLDWMADHLPMGRAKADAFLTSYDKIGPKDVVLDDPKDFLNHAVRYQTFLRSLVPEFTAYSGNDLNDVVKCMDYLLEKTGQNILKAKSVMDQILKEKKATGALPVKARALLVQALNTELEKQHGFSVKELELNGIQEFLQAFPEYHT